MPNIFLKKTSDFARHFVRAERLAHFSAVNSRLDILVLGSFQIMCALDFSHISCCSAENFALKVQPFKYDDLLLRQFCGAVKNGGWIVFGICPFSFLLDDFFPSMQKSLSFKRYYFLLSEKNMPCYSEKERKKLMLRYSLCKKWNDFWGVKVDDIPVRKGIVTGEELVADADMRSADWQQLFFSSSDFRQLLFPERLEKTVALLHEMIVFAEKRSLRTALFLPPLSSALLERLDEKVLVEYLYKPLNEAASGTSALIINEMRNAKFASREYFHDSLLLSSKGRNVLTESLIEKLLNRGQELKGRLC